jgi:hypothetical protein
MSKFAIRVALCALFFVVVADAFSPMPLKSSRVIGACSRGNVHRARGRSSRTWISDPRSSVSA